MGLRRDVIGVRRADDGLRKAGCVCDAFHDRSRAAQRITGSIDAGNVRAEGRTALCAERDAVVREHLPDGFEHVRLHEQHGGDGTGKHVDGSV